MDLFDTAGEREVGGGGAAEVERSGQALAASLRERADLVLWLQSAQGTGAAGETVGESAGPTPI